MRQLIGVNVGSLFHHAQALDGHRGRHDPSHAQAGKSHFRKTIDVDDEVRTIQLLQRRQPVFAGVQPRVNVIFHHWHLMPRSQLQHFSARSQRHRRSRGILKIRREDDQLHAVRRQGCLQRLQIQSQRSSRLGMRAHRYTKAACARTAEDRHRAGIRRIFQNNGIAGPYKCFADQIQGLLAAVGDQEIFVPRRNAVVLQKLKQRLFQRRISIRGAEVEDIGGFAAQDGIHASLQIFDRKQLLRGPGQNKREGILRSAGCQARENFFAALVRKK